MEMITNFDGPRLVRREEWAASHALSDLCFGGHEYNAEELRALGEDPTPGETYVIAAQGKPVSQISVFFTPLSVYGCATRVGSIGGVCTHPAYREHRLASRLMQHCTERMAANRARIMVISGGRGLYRRLGSVSMGRFAQFKLRAGEIRPGAPAVTLRPAQKADAVLCSRLYQAEAARFQRPLEKFAGYFRPHEIGFHAEDWIANLDGQDAAYLLFSVPWGEPMETPGMPFRALVEYAGSRAAVAGGLAAAASQPGIREIWAEAPWQDTDLIYLLRQVSGQPEQVGLDGHTVRVINLPGLMADLSAYVRAQLPPSLRRGLKFEQSGPLLGAPQNSASEDCYAITRGKERLVLDGADMTRLVLGDADGALSIQPGGALQEIIQALFQLPSFMVGMDYH